MKWVGPKSITWLSLSLAIVACVILSKTDTDASNEADPLKLGDNLAWLEKPLEGIIFYYDGAIAGYLLICIAAAFLSTASF